MYCERCGRFSLFRKVCSVCAAATPAQYTDPTASSDPSTITKTPASKFGTHIKTSRVLSISVNGKKATFNLSGGITDGLVDQIADQTKLTPEEARALLQAQGSAERMVEVGNQIAQAHHLGPVKCPACSQEVPPGRFCSQCGHSLTPTP